MVPKHITPVQWFSKEKHLYWAANENITSSVKSNRVDWKEQILCHSPKICMHKYIVVLTRSNRAFGKTQQKKHSFVVINNVIRKFRSKLVLVKLRVLLTATMLVTDVGYGMCWRQRWNVGDRFNTLNLPPTYQKNANIMILSPASWICLHQKAINITVSPTSL